MKSSTSSPLDSMTSSTISATRSSRCSRTSSSSWVAPRTALTATRHTLTTALQAGCVEQHPQLVARQLAKLSRRQTAQQHGPDRGARETPHGVADLVEQPSHDAV